MTPESPWPRGALALASVFVLHEAVLRGIRLDGVRPDLLLGFAIVAAIVAGPEVGAVAGFASGVLVDLFVNTPFGLSALVFCLVAFAAGNIQDAIGTNTRWSVPALVALTSITAEGVWAALGTVLGVPGLLHPRLLVVVAVVATVNGAISLPLAALLRWAFSGASRARPGAPPRGFAT